MPSRYFVPFFAAAALAVLLTNAASTAAADGPHLATGIKIGEVTQNSAIVWVRLTRNAQRNPDDAPQVKIEYAPADADTRRRGRAVQAIDLSGATTVADLRQAAPGIDGDVRLLYSTNDVKVQPGSTDWQPVDGLRDFTCQFQLTDLKPGATYQLEVETRSVDGTLGDTVAGTFRTAPAADVPARVVFTVVTGQGDDDQDSPAGFKIYPSMLKLDPDFFVHTGDILYYDRLAKTVDLARYHWQRMYSWPTNVEFHKQVASYFEKDDHDTWVNDCWPTMQTDYMHEFTFRQGQEIYREQVPIQGPNFRTVRWGRDLQIWLTEGRDFRSPNDMPDGPEKTIWGEEQKKWFKASVEASDATFRVLISPTPLVGPDRDNKHDNHSNADFQHEGRELRAFIAAQKNMTVVCGDRHWQYMSVDPQTGLREYSCGPASNKHAGGWKKDDFREEFHRYMKVIGGFLSATVDPSGDKPTLTYRYHNVNGAVQFEDVLTAP